MDPSESGSSDTLSFADGPPTQRDSVAEPGPRGWGVGARIGGYILEELLGKGATGAVYRARQVATGRRVALKGVTISAHTDDLARFTREAAAQAQVDDHPNLVRIYEAAHAHGQAYLAVELVEGGDLRRRLQTKVPLPEAEAAGVVAQLARGRGIH